MSLIESIRDAVGEQAAASLVKVFGGRKVYVPIVASETHPIGRAIGAQAAAALSRRFGGEYLDVANLQGCGPRRRARSALYQAILDLAAKNVPRSEIARRQGCSRQYVGTVIRGNG